MAYRPTIRLAGNGDTLSLGWRGPDRILLSQGATGLGWGPHEVTTAGLARGGSVLRHRRLGEASMTIPVFLAGAYEERWEDRRRLERLCDGEVAVTVVQPGGLERTRYGYLREGLEGSYGAAEASQDGQRLVLDFLCPDPWWYGAEQGETFQLTDRRKILLASGEGRIDRVNLHSNPGAEVSVSGFWQFGGTSGQTIARTTSGAFSGSGALLVTATGGSGTPHVLMPPWQAEASATYQLAFQHRSSAGVDRLRVQWWREMTGSTSYWTTAGPSSEVPASESWQRAVFDAPAVSPTGRVMAQIQLLGPDGDAPEGEWARFDEFLVEAGQAGAYFDGSTPSSSEVVYSWDGDPGLSASRATKVDDISGSTFLPIMVSESLVQGVRDIYISGDAPAWPVWTIRGPGEDLLIEHMGTGERIFIEGEFGGQVVVDTRPAVQDITGDGVDPLDMWARVSTDTRLFPLTPGSNRVRLSMARTTPTSEIVLTYRETWKAGH